MLPAEFIDEIRAQLGDETEAFLRALDAPPTLAMRINALRPCAEDAAKPFAGERVPWAADGRYLISGARPGASLAHTCGAFYLQEASAMVSAAVLNAQPGEKILDLCAAPGGKSSQIAFAMRGQGVLVSNEPIPSRAKILAENLERLGVVNAIVTNEYPERLYPKWREFFDAVLVDAPCSGEGMFRREPAARDEWNPRSPEGCARRQSGILDCAAEMVRPGGRLVYSTCTFNRTENEFTIEAFLDRHPEFTPEEFALPGLGNSTNGALRVWPHRAQGDGHFVARLRKAGEPAAPIKMKPPRERKKPQRPAKTVSEESNESLIARLSEIAALPIVLLSGTPIRQADYIHLLPAGAPPLDGIRTAKPGLCLMRVGRSHIQPMPALAMACTDESAPRDWLATAHNTFELPEPEALRFLNGERPESSDGKKRWTLLTCNRLPLGFCKLA